jgi:hypothetical protein
MSYAAPIVFVLDDNLSVGKSLKLLILNVGRRPGTLQFRSGNSRFTRSSLSRAVRFSTLPGSTGRCDAVGVRACNA